MSKNLANLLHIFKIIFILGVIISIMFKINKHNNDEKISIDITIISEMVVFVLSIGILLYEFHPWKRLHPKVEHLRPIILSIVLFLFIELILSISRTTLLEII